MFLNLIRNQTSKIKFFSFLSKTKIDSHFSDIEIESQRRNLTELKLGVKGKHYIGQTTLNWQIHNAKGLSAFSAMKTIPGGYNSKYRVSVAKVGVVQSLSEKILLRSNLVMQLADKKAPSLIYLNAGGRQDVRGFRDNSLYGPTGWYISNNIEFPKVKIGGVNVAAYYGLDYGAIKRHSRQEVSKQHVAGQALGIRMKIGQINLEVVYARAISRPDEFETDEKSSQIYSNISYSF